MLAHAPIHCVFKSVLIVDDHPLFCDALSMTLQSVANIGEIHTADRLDRAIEMLEGGLEPDAIMLDLNMPGVQGLEAVRKLIGLAKAPVIVVSSMTEDCLISQVIHSGAAGYVPKHSQRDVFRNAFKALQNGETFLPEGCVLLEPDEDSVRNFEAQRLATLTKQQTRILELISQGKLNKQIAFDLSIAETTVKAHVSAIIRKLGVQSRTQAVLMAKRAPEINRL